MGGGVRHVWPAVTMVIAALAAITGLSIVGADTTQVVMFVGAAVVPTVTVLLTSGRVESKVEDVHRQVNGRMSQLIEAKTIPAEPTVEGD